MLKGQDVVVIRAPLSLTAAVSRWLAARSRMTIRTTRLNSLLPNADFEILLVAFWITNSGQGGANVRFAISLPNLLDLVVHEPNGNSASWQLTLELKVPCDCIAIVAYKESLDVRERRKTPKLTEKFGTRASGCRVEL